MSFQILSATLCCCNIRFGITVKKGIKSGISVASIIKAGIFFIIQVEYSGRFYTACPVMETVDSGMMETAIPEIQNQ